MRPGQTPLPGVLLSRWCCLGIVCGGAGSYGVGRAGCAEEPRGACWGRSQSPGTCLEEGQPALAEVVTLQAVNRQSSLQRRQGWQQLNLAPEVWLAWLLPST